MSESELREMISEEIDKRIHIAPIDENAPGVTLSALPHCRTGVMVVIDSIARFAFCEPIPDTS
jgi:hypothetical protein